MRRVSRICVALAIVAALGCKKRTAPAPQPVVLGPPVQIDYCTPEINRRMTECVPTCGACEFRGGGHVCRFAPGDEQDSVNDCIAECRKQAESDWLGSR